MKKGGTHGSKSPLDFSDRFYYYIYYLFQIFSLCKLASIIRNSLKAFFFKNFRRFGLERHQPFFVLSHQKFK